MTFSFSSFGWHISRMAREDELRVEQLLATARLFLAVVALVAVFLDPNEPAVFAAATYSLLAGYALFSVVLAGALRVWPDRLLVVRAAIHTIDIASAGAITALTQGASSPFFVFFIFVVLAAALRWGGGPTAATGGAVAVWYLVEALLHARLFEELDVTRFLMRTAYLLVATAVLAQLAGVQRAFYTENYVLSRLLARVKRGDRFVESLEQALSAAVQYAGAHSALLALYDHTAERLHVWRAQGANLTAVPLTLTELPRSERHLLFPEPPQDAAVWLTVRRGPETLRLRALGPTGRALRSDRDARAHGAVLERFAARRAITVMTTQSEWEARLMLFDPVRASDGDLRFFQRFAAQIGPALYSHYLVSRLRTRIGAVERARISRELHDGLIQSLIGLEFQVQALRARPAGSGELQDTLAGMQQHLRQAILDTRDLMAELRPPTLGERDLLAEVSTLVERFRIDTGLDVRISSDVDDIDCPPRTAHEVARIVREALVNVRKHAGATRVRVHVGRADERWTLVVEDDGRGCGFAGRRSLMELDARRQGPAVIKERVRAINGELTVQSGNGTRLEISWPRWRQLAAS